MSTKSELEKALKGFDWYYSMSDDGGVWRRGERRKKEIQDMINNTDPKVAKALIKKYSKPHSEMFTVKENRMLDLNDILNG